MAVLLLAVCGLAAGNKKKKKKKKLFARFFGLLLSFPRGSAPFIVTIVTLIAPGVVFNHIGVPVAHRGITTASVQIAHRSSYIEYKHRVRSLHPLSIF